MKMDWTGSRAWISPGANLMLRHALPNSVTILALCFGLTALIFAAEFNFTAAIACVLVAALLDACDGRVARATGTASRFGAELDSLSDVICFGAVPAFILYQWGLHAFGLGGWIACLSVAAACALRLARFNVMVDLPEGLPGRGTSSPAFRLRPAPSSHCWPVYVASGEQ